MLTDSDVAEMAKRIVLQIKQGRMVATRAEARILASYIEFTRPSRCAIRA
jgi:hypothetical protein